MRLVFQATMHVVSGTRVTMTDIPINEDHRLSLYWNELMLKYRKYAAIAR